MWIPLPKQIKKKWSDATTLQWLLFKEIPMFKGDNSENIASRVMNLVTEDVVHHEEHIFEV